MGVKKRIFPGHHRAPGIEPHVTDEQARVDIDGMQLRPPACRDPRTGVRAPGDPIVTIAVGVGQGVADGRTAESSEKRNVARSIAILATKYGLY